MRPQRGSDAVLCAIPLPAVIRRESPSQCHTTEEGSSVDDCQPQQIQYNGNAVHKRRPRFVGSSEGPRWHTYDCADASKHEQPFMPQAAIG